MSRLDLVATLNVVICRLQTNERSGVSVLGMLPRGCAIADGFLRVLYAALEKISSKELVSTSFDGSASP